MPFYGLRFVLAIGIAIAVFVLSGITCCISRIPYLGTVLVLLVFVFWRAYSLYYMEQLGLQIFPARNRHGSHTTNGGFRGEARP